MEDYLNTAKESVDKLALEVVMLEPKDAPGLGVVLNRLRVKSQQTQTTVPTQ